jgi:hypothetical protein
MAKKKKKPAKKKAKKVKKKKVKKKADVKAKKFPGTTFKKKPRPKLVGDSYQANERDLKKVRRIGRRRGVSKAEIIRYGCALAIQAYEALANGKKKLTIKLSDIA